MRRGKAGEGCGPRTEVAIRVGRQLRKELQRRLRGSCSQTGCVKRRRSAAAPSVGNACRPPAPSAARPAGSPTATAAGLACTPASLLLGALPKLPTGFAADDFTLAQNVKRTGKRSLNFLSGTYRLIKKFPAIQEWRVAEVASEIHTQSEYTVLILSIGGSNRNSREGRDNLVSRVRLRCVEDPEGVLRRVPRGRG